jgi:hypothetical protein
MSDLRARIGAAWNQAAADLGIRFTSPYTVTLENGKRIDCLGLIHNFGRPFGTLIFVHGEECGVRPEEIGEEYFYSELTDYYAQYDRKLFAATLDDWGWFGPQGQTPSWYTGKAWA